MKIGRVIKRIRVARLREEGFALLLAIIAVAILGFVGASFALMIQNEARSVNSTILAQQAMYVAESGIQDVLFQRSKMPAQLCFPFYSYDKDKTPQQRLDEIKSLTGFSAGGLSGAPAGTGTCDPTVDNIPDSPTTEELPCWPYNEKLYANTIHWGPDWNCHDGSDDTKCPTYRPLLWWPSSDDGLSVAWKDWEESNTNRPLANAKQSSGARYTTGFFTLCNDDFLGIVKPGADTQPGYNLACIKTAAEKCNQFVFRLSVVSIGEVQSGNKIIRRAVKTDFTPPALYTGVIDKYVDLTLMWQTNINGPIHINGWWNGNKWQAFLVSYSASLAPIWTALDPPEVVSVSYPEDPANPDWQPPIALSHQIVWVHLPTRIEIPQVNWNKWEDRMKQLYTKAKNEYADSTVYKLKYCAFNPADPMDTRSDCPTSTDDAYHNPLQLPGASWSQKCNVYYSRSDQDMDNPMPCFKCPNNASTNACPGDPLYCRIHNCNRNTYQVWSASSKYIFDLYDPNTGSWVVGNEPASSVPSATNPGPRDRSLKYQSKFLLNPDFGLGCLTCVIFGGINLNSFVTCCIGKQELRHAFAFMGKHEFRDFVYIDGVMGIGTRTPYHSCGSGDGGFSIYCIVIDINVLGIQINFEFGLPHWHLGETSVTGEVLFNGRAYMADWIKIEGGTIYTDGSIIKDESSGFDVTLHLDQLICWIVGLVIPPIVIFGFELDICPIIMIPINLIMGAMGVSWWPDIDLTNNELIDFEAYLDIDGMPRYLAVMNPGTLYTRGDFMMLKPKWDVISFAANTLLGLFLPFLELSASVDPIRIFNGGAIVAGGKWVGGDPQYVYGNIFLDQHPRMDILTYNPATDERSIGYVLARGGLTVWSDIIADYGLGGFVDKCSGWAVGGMDPDCAAAGIFYSGGIAAGANPVSGFGRRTGKVDDVEVAFNYKPTSGILASLPVMDRSYGPTCLNPDEPGFWGDTGNLTCWAGGIGDIFGGNANEFNIRGHVFAGQASAMPATHMRLDQDGTVRNDAVTRQYFKQLGGVPIDWIEIDIPPNLQFLPLQ